MKMIVQDQAVTMSNPRVLSAIYFSLLAIIITISIDTTLYALGIEQILPFSKAIILAVVTAAIAGAVFGERIIHCEQPYKKQAFLWGFIMVIVALPFYNLGFIYLMRENHAVLFAHATTLHIIYLYLFVLGYSFILAGLWLAIIAGLAAVYLRTYAVYYILQSLYQRRKSVDDVTSAPKAEGIEPPSISIMRDDEQ